MYLECWTISCSLQIQCAQWFYQKPLWSWRLHGNVCITCILWCWKLAYINVVSEVISESTYQNKCLLTLVTCTYFSIKHFSTHQSPIMHSIPCHPSSWSLLSVALLLSLSHSGLSCYINKERRWHGACTDMLPPSSDHIVILYAGN